MTGQWRIVSIGIPLTMLALISACGSSAFPSATSSTVHIGSHTPLAGSAPTTTSSTASTAAVGQQVLAILTNGNAAVQRDKEGSNTNAAATAVANDFASVAQQLQAIMFPGGTTADDAKTLVAILNKLSEDASQLAGASAALIAPITANITNDEGTEKADAAALRHDLGLPPAPVGS
jgi:hypothetical protein